MYAKKYINISGRGGGMLNIDEKQLKLLLERKKKRLERPKYSGIGEIISSVSLMITLALSDFSHLTIVKPLYFKITAWSIAIAILIYGVFIFVRSIAETYSVDQLYSEIADIDPEIEHPFNIVVIRNSYQSGKYLVFKSKRWNCWLFPNYHCSTGVFSKTKELKCVKESIKRDLNISGEFNFTYIGDEISEKYSVGDKLMKKFHFYYFQAPDITIGFNNKRSFRCNGKKYCWKTLDQMYSSKNIVKKNKDVLDYVRYTCDMS